MTTLQCLSRDVLKEYLSGWTDEERSETIEKHLSECVDCEQTIHSLERDPETLIEFVRNSHNQTDIKAPKADSAIAYALSKSKKLSAGHDATADLWQPPIGDLGPYELIRPLGHGGMASVYLARHRQLGKQVAIKLLPSRQFRSDHYTARFQREIRTAGQLNHPAIVSATDAGEHGGTHYLVMEYIDGLDLSRVARWTGPLAIADACSIMRTVAIGLSHAHAAGIVHRDIKPSNLMLSTAGDVKILDFGLAQVSLWDEVSAELTTVGQLMGTLDYMAPEQAEHPEAVDYRADLYSLGATLFRLLCGRAPLAAAPDLSPLVKLRLLASHQPPQLDSLRTDAPEKLVDLVSRLLSSNPAIRPASAAHVAEQLAEFTEGAELRSLISSAQAKSIQEPVATSTRTALPTMELSVSSRGSGRRKSRWLLAVSVLPLALFMGVLITLETQKGQLVIESEDADVEVKLLRDGELYEQLKIVPGTNTTRLYAGQYEVVIDAASDAVMFDQPKIEIKRGETVVAKVGMQAKNERLPSAVKGGRASLPSSLSPLRVNDQILVVSPVDKSINARVVVMSDLTIKLPLVGLVSVQNETVDSLQSKLRKAYENYIKNGELQVFLGQANQFKSESFVVDTAPVKSGRPPMNSSVLEPGDGIFIRSLKDDIATYSTVLADYTVRLPLIGTVNVENNSILDLERKLFREYEKYVNQPSIEVFRNPQSDLSLETETGGTQIFNSQDSNSLNSYASGESEGNNRESQSENKGLLFEGKSLVAWLQVFERERSPLERRKAMDAMYHLASDRKAAKQIEAVLLRALPPSDPFAFDVLRKCQADLPSFLELMLRELDRADTSYRSQILGSLTLSVAHGALHGTSFDDWAPIRKWIVSNILEVKDEGELLPIAAEMFLFLHVATKCTDAQKQQLLDDLLACDRLGFDFWLESATPFQRAPDGTEKGTPQYLAAVESQAVKAVQSRDTETKYLARALIILQLLHSEDAKRLNLQPKIDREVVLEALTHQAERLISQDSKLGR